MATTANVVMGIIIVALIIGAVVLGFLFYTSTQSQYNLQANLNAARANANRLAQEKQNAINARNNILATKQDLESQMNAIIEQAASNAINAQVAQDQLDVLQEQLNALEQAAANHSNQIQTLTNARIAAEQALANAEIAAQPLVFWHRSGYNKSFEKAKDYCASHDGRLATKDEMLAAYANGYDVCSSGWMYTNDWDPLTGFVTQTARPGCGGVGFSGWPGATNLERPLGAYCVGNTVPEDSIPPGQLTYIPRIIPLEMPST